MNDKLKVLLADLHTKMPDVQVLVDPGLSEDTPTWLDLRAGDKTATIEYRPLTGFGLYTPDSDESGDDFGTGPTEIYRTIEPLLVRLGKYFRSGASQIIGLRELRELCLLTQEELGERAGKKQSAISKVESRDELRLGTLVEYVKTLGGNVNIRAHFEDFDVRLSVSSSDAPKVRRTGSATWVNRPIEASSDRVNMAARSTPKHKRATASFLIEIQWIEGASHFTLKQCDHGFVLYLTSTATAPAREFSNAKWLHWFDKTYKLARSTTDPAIWDVELTLKAAQLHMARMKAELTERGEEGVLPWVS
jgi:transcriptional regulator with XRE-family HTH domain